MSASVQHLDKRHCHDSGRQFAMAFACAVTRASEKESDWIAKNGDESIFALLSRLVPEVPSYHDYFVRIGYAQKTHTFEN